MNYILIIAAALLLLTGGFIVSTKYLPQEPTVQNPNAEYQFRTIADFEIFEQLQVRVNDRTIIADLAVTGVDRQQGLSGRSALGEDEGLFFVFTHDSRHKFWMKEMNFPIDIIWLDRNLKVVGIKENALPESYPDEVFEPQYGDARYVLEVNAGFVEQEGIAANTQFEIEGIE